MSEISKILINLTDLHMHLGASSTAHLLREMGHSQWIKLNEKDYFKFIEKVTITEETSREEYHHYFDTTHVIQSSPFAVERSIYEAVSLSFRKSNITNLEIRFNPMKRNKDGLYDIDRVIFSALVGMKRAMMEYPIKVGLIIEADRRFTIEQNLIVLDKAIKFRNDWIIGVDVSWPTTEEFSFKPLVEKFLEAKKAGLWITIHTWEETWADEMLEVVNTIQPHRIWHGIRCINDPELMKILSEKNIVLELCPTSNLTTQMVKSRDEFWNIIKTLKEYKVPFTINSDGPVFLRTNVREEFKKLYEKKILDFSDIENCIKIAKEASFIK